jgi:hypothetical protein
VYVPLAKGTAQLIVFSVMIRCMPANHCLPIFYTVKRYTVKLVGLLMFSPTATGDGNPT